MTDTVSKINASDLDTGSLWPYITSYNFQLERYKMKWAPLNHETPGLRVSPRSSLPQTKWVLISYVLVGHHRLNTNCSLLKTGQFRVFLTQQLVTDSPNPDRHLDLRACSCCLSHLWLFFLGFHKVHYKLYQNLFENVGVYFVKVRHFIVI